MIKNHNDNNPMSDNGDFFVTMDTFKIVAPKGYNVKASDIPENPSCAYCGATIPNGQWMQFEASWSYGMSNGISCYHPACWEKKLAEAPQE